MKQLIAIVAIAFTLTACAPGQPLAFLNPTPTPTITPTPTPTVTPTVTPIPTATPIPCHQQTQEYLDKTIPIFREYSDNFTLANNTARIALSPIIAKMQENNRTFQAIAPPACAATLNKKMAVTMESGIDAFISFMAHDSDDTLKTKFATAAENAKTVNLLIEDFKNKRPPFDK
jgi:hypothetical protein